MLTIYVLDSTAESRTKIVSQINSYLSIDSKDHFLLPRLSIRPISKHELKFHAAPDICIIGDQFIQSELGELTTIRKQMPHSALLVRTTALIDSLSIIEQIARLGIDDTISENASAFEFFRKIILLARKTAVKRNGKLILVDSGKGGLGVTSLVAGLGECLVEYGRKVALIDLDWESQDLSRFLQVRPFLNENLQVIFDRSRPITEESVAQCLTRVWYDEENLLCMAPAPECDELYDARSLHAKILLSILEILDTSYDCVIIDAGSIKGALQRTIYRVADEVLFVINNDPASLFATVDKISKAKGLMSASANIHVVENSPIRYGIKSEILKQEIFRATKIDNILWSDQLIPNCVNAARWPGSGSTFYSSGIRTIKQAIENIAGDCGLIEKHIAKSRPIWSAAQLKMKTVNFLRTSKTVASLPPISAPNSNEPLIELPWKSMERFGNREIEATNSQESENNLLSPSKMESSDITEEPLITKAAVA